MSESQPPAAPLDPWTEIDTRLLALEHAPGMCDPECEGRCALCPLTETSSLRADIEKLVATERQQHALRESEAYLKGYAAGSDVTLDMCIGEDEREVVRLLQRDLTAARAEIARLTDQWDRLVVCVQEDTADRSPSAYRVHVTKTYAEVVQLKAEIARLTEERDELQGGQLLNRNAIRLLRLRAEAAEASRDGAQEEIQLLRWQLGDRNREVDDLQQQIAALQQELAIATTAWEGSQASVRLACVVIDGLRAQLAEPPRTVTTANEHDAGRLSAESDGCSCRYCELAAHLTGRPDPMSDQLENPDAEVSLVCRNAGRDPALLGGSDASDRPRRIAQIRARLDAWRDNCASDEPGADDDYVQIFDAHSADDIAFLLAHLADLT